MPQWIQYNDSTKLLTRSIDNGASFSPLLLDASQIGYGTIPAGRLPANIVYNNVEVDLYAGSGTAYYGAPLEIQTVNTPRVSFHWPGVVASQIGMDSAGTIRTFDNPGTGYAAFTAGLISAIGNIHVQGNVHNTAGYLFPGNAEAGGAYQGSWYLAGHTTYGLYTNTGLYIEAGVYPNFVEARAHIRAATGLYDYGRSVPIGVWTTKPFSAADYYGIGGATWVVSAATYNYMIEGQTMWISIFTTNNNVTVSGSAVAIALPAGYSAVRPTFGIAELRVAGGTWQTGWAQSEGGTSFNIWTTNMNPIGTGALEVRLTFPVAIG